MAKTIRTKDKCKVIVNPSTGQATRYYEDGSRGPIKNPGQYKKRAPRTPFSERWMEFRRRDTKV